MKGRIRKTIALLIMIVIVSGLFPRIEMLSTGYAASADSIACFRQTDSEWSSYGFGKRNDTPTVMDTTIGDNIIVNNTTYYYGSGCSLLALTNAVSALLGLTSKSQLRNYDVYPTDLADYAIQKGFRTTGAIDDEGLYSTWCSEKGSKYGISYAGKVSSFNNTAKTHIQHGGVVIYNAPGHFMCIAAYDSASQQYLVLDSAPSKSRQTAAVNGKRWVSETILTEGASNDKKLIFKHGFLLAGSGTVIPTPTVPPIPISSDCGCSESYKGTYTVNTTSKNLNVRKGHGTGYSVVGSLSKGAEVEVLKGNGTWAHIIYDGSERYINMQYLKKKTDTISYTAVSGTVKHYGVPQIYTTEGDVIQTQVITPTSATPDCIIHVDSPSGQYDGSNHIEILGWIASRYSLTYVMCESDSFGQMNLTDNLSDATEELNNAGYSDYSTKVRFRSVIDRRYLQPNTTYYFKVWAGLSNGGTGGVGSQTFEVTSIQPTVIRFDANKPANSYSNGSDIPVAGTIVSLNPISNVSGVVKDITGSSDVIPFDLTLTQDQSLVSNDSVYSYGARFSGIVPRADLKISNNTASVYITATSNNDVDTVKATTFKVGNIILGDYNSHMMTVDNHDNLWIVEGSNTYTVSGYVYANAPIPYVQFDVLYWENHENRGQYTCNLNAITPPNGYSYAVRYEYTLRPGDFSPNTEYRIHLWYGLMNSNGNGDTKYNDDLEKLITRNLTVESFAVTYNANGGNGAPSSQTKQYGKGLTLQTGIPTRTGYTFRGWATSKDSRKINYLPGDSVPSRENHNITLYAVWEKATIVPADLISYNLSAMVTIKNAPKVYQLTPSIKTKYRFTAGGTVGANVVIQNDTGATIDTISNASEAIKEIFLEDNQTYYIVVKPFATNTTGTVTINILVSYPVTFEMNGGFGGPTETIYQYPGETIILPETVPTQSPVAISLVPEEGGLTHEQVFDVSFAYWANYNYGLIDTWQPGDIISRDYPLELVAQWSYGNLGDLWVPEKEGMVFLGWEDKDGRMVTDEWLAMENATYYAIWVPAIPLEGIKLTPKTMTLEVGDVTRFTLSALPTGAILPVVTWNSSNIETAIVDETGQITVLAEGVSVITATSEDGQFSASATVIVGDDVFTVTYDANGGIGAPESVTQSYTQTFVASNLIPERTGYLFLGWAFEADSTEAIIQPGEEMLIDRDRILYAVWRANSYAVIFDANGGENSPQRQIKTYGEALILTDETPTRDGFSFAGWAVNQNADKADYLPGDSYTEESGVTLYALWREHAHAISLNYTYLALMTGDERTLKTTVTPSAAQGALVLWTSSNDAVASVVNGKIAAHSAGQTVITAIVADDPTLTATCRVTVANASQGSGAVTAPTTQTVTAPSGGTVQAEIKFASAYAAYAKIVYSYDSSILELTDVTAAGSWVTVGNNALVLAVASGKITDGTQATLTFRIADDAEPVLAEIDVIVVECYTLDEIASSLYAVVADSIQVGCAEHQLTLIAPIPATNTAYGFGPGWVCSVCGEVFSTQATIHANRCYWLPADLTSIEEGAFEGLPMWQVTLPNGVKTIGSGAFRNCEALLVAVIPNSVTTIADDAFSGCDSLCICGRPGSYAETYAVSHNIPFAAIE